MSTNLTGNSERKETGSEIFEPIEDFIQQIDDRYIEIKPNPALPAQIKLAQTLSTLMTRYNDLKRLEDEYSERSKQQVNQSWQIPPVETELVMGRLEEKMKLAFELEPLIRDAKTQGMVHDGTRVMEKLKECQEKLLKSQEDNWKLSQQLLEYKNKLGLKK